jgi:hypothetical protein
MPRRRLTKSTVEVLADLLMRDELPGVEFREP